MPQNKFTMQDTRKIVEMMLGGKTSQLNPFFRSFAAPSVPSDRSGLAESMPKDSLLTMSYAVYGANGLEQNHKDVHDTAAHQGGPGNLRYQVGSVCKMAMLALTLRLCDQNKISLDDSIASIISKFTVHPLIIQHQAKLNPITIKQLLTHCSGLRDGSPDPKMRTTFGLPNPFNPIVEFAVRRGDPIDGKIKFYEQPGPFYYANSNFAILAYLLEAIYKNDLDKIFDEQIKKPLGLTDSTMAEVDVDDLAHGEIVAPNGTAREYIYLFGAGCLYATPADCAKFFHAFFTDRSFISQQSLDIAKVVESDPRQYEVVRKDLDEPMRWKTYGGMIEMFLYSNQGFSSYDDAAGKFVPGRNELGVREIYGHGGWTSAHSMFLVFDPITNKSYCAAVSKRHIYTPKPKPQAAASSSATMLHYFAACCCIPTASTHGENERLINEDRNQYTNK